MFKLQWKDTYKSGFKEIDSQHEELFRLVNLFGIKDIDSVMVFDVINLLDTFLSLAKIHFDQEETLMIRMEYPLFLYHKKMHEDLTLELHKIKNDLTKNLANTKLNFAHEVYEFSTDWLNNHILKEDMAFFDFCSKTGIIANREYENLTCAVYDSDNTFIGLGTITNVLYMLLKIKHSWNDIVSFKQNDIVTIKLLDLDGEEVFWTARVYMKKKNELEIFNTKLKPVVKKKI